MLKKSYSARALAALAFIWAGGMSEISAQEIVAVLSSDSGYYQEAFLGFRATMGTHVHTVNLKTDELKLGADTKVVVAFGAKAALQRYPDNVTVVYALAPGTKINRQRRFVKVQMLPPPITVLAKLKEIQPNVRRLAIFWISEAIEDYLLAIEKAGKALGMEVISERLNELDELPEVLRSIKRKPDAIFLPPDPILINNKSFAVLKEYSWSNDVPLYAPTEGLVEMGATAAVSTGFREIGRSAAVVAKMALADKLNTDVWYPEQTELSINQAAAVNSGLQISPEAVRKFNKVLP